jgi:hypothetical protein
MVALAPLLLVTLYLPGEIMVRCHEDGLLRPAPCCAHDEAGGDSGPAFEQRNCCDRELTATHRPVSEATRASDDQQICVTFLTALPGAGAVPIGPPDGARAAARRHGPSRGGPSIVLVKHAFLI